MEADCQSQLTARDAADQQQCCQAVHPQVKDFHCLLFCVSELQKNESVFFLFIG